MDAQQGPSTKRRAVGQISKEDPCDDDDGVRDPGTWQSAPHDRSSVKDRKIIKIRRGNQVEPSLPATSAADAQASAPAANPFAGISLTKSANPFAGISLLGGGGGFGGFAAKQVPTPAPVVISDVKGADQDQPQESEASKKEETEAEAAPAPSPLTGFAAWATAAVGSSQPGSKSGFGAAGFSGAAGNFQFPLLVPSTTRSASHPDPEPTPLFGSPEKALSADAATAKRKTGEEDEKTVLTADGVLYEFDAVHNKWRERGRGEFRVNVSANGMGRLLMRQVGALRLLLNAKLFPSTPVAKMAGDVGVTFGCINVAGQSGDDAAAAADEEKPAGEAAEVAPAATTDGSSAKGTDGEAAAAGGEVAEGGEAKPAVEGTPSARATAKVSTWALKIRDKEKVELVASTLERVKSEIPATTQEASV